MGIYIEGLDKQVQKGTESITVAFWDKDELIINEYDIGDMSKVTDLDLVRCEECIYEHSCGHQINRHGLTLKLTCCEYGERKKENVNTD